MVMVALEEMVMVITVVVPGALDTAPAELRVVTGTVIVVGTVTVEVSVEVTVDCGGQTFPEAPVVM